MTNAPEPLDVCMTRNDTQSLALQGTDGPPISRRLNAVVQPSSLLAGLCRRLLLLDPSLAHLDVAIPRTVLLSVSNLSLLCREPGQRIQGSALLRFRDDGRRLRLHHSGGDGRVDGYPPLGAAGDDGLRGRREQSVRLRARATALRRGNGNRSGLRRGWCKEGEQPGPFIQIWLDRMGPLLEGASVVIVPDEVVQLLGDAGLHVHEPGEALACHSPMRLERLDELDRLAGLLTATHRLRAVYSRRSGHVATDIHPREVVNIQSRAGGALQCEDDERRLDLGVPLLQRQDQSDKVTCRCQVALGRVRVEQFLLRGDRLGVLHGAKRAPRQERNVGEALALQNDPAQEKSNVQHSVRRGAAGGEVHLQGVLRILELMGKGIHKSVERCREPSILRAP